MPSKRRCKWACSPAPIIDMRDQLAALDVARMTPIEALNRLHELSEEAKK